MPSEAHTYTHTHTQSGVSPEPTSPTAEAGINQEGTVSQVTRSQVTQVPACGQVTLCAPQGRGTRFCRARAPRLCPRLPPRLPSGTCERGHRDPGSVSGRFTLVAGPRAIPQGIVHHPPALLASCDVHSYWNKRERARLPESPAIPVETSAMGPDVSRMCAKWREHALEGSCRRHALLLGKTLGPEVTVV